VNSCQSFILVSHEASEPYGATNAQTIPVIGVDLSTWPVQQLMQEAAVAMRFVASVISIMSGVWR